MPAEAEKEIPEISYTFPKGHKHRYDIYGINIEMGNLRINYSYIYVYADFDRNNNGRDDLYMAMTALRNNETLTVGGSQYYRLIRQLW